MLDEMERAFRLR
jgi:hypothetical protein